MTNIIVMCMQAGGKFHFQSLSSIALYSPAYIAHAKIGYTNYIANFLLFCGSDIVTLALH